MAVSSERFELFEDEVDGLIEQIRNEVENEHRKRKGFKSQFYVQIRSQLSEVKKIIGDMEQEAKMAPMQFR